jgi:hypothetical protein
MLVLRPGKTLSVVLEACLKQHVEFKVVQGESGVIRGLISTNVSLMSPGQECTFSIIWRVSDDAHSHAALLVTLHAVHHYCTGKPNAYFKERCGQSSDTAVNGFLSFRYIFSEGWGPLEDPDSVDFTITYNVSELQDCLQGGTVCEGGQGMRSGNKCFTLIDSRQNVNPDNPLWNTTKMTWGDASVLCRSKGRNLASIVDDQQLDDVLKLWRYGQRQPAEALVGLKRCGPSDPQMYRRLIRWLDGTIVYSDYLLYRYEYNELVYVIDFIGDPPRSGALRL